MKPERVAAEEAAARAYADLIATTDPGDIAVWRERNRAIVRRWSVTALERVKRRAWVIFQKRGEAWDAHVRAAGSDHLCGDECRRAVNEEANQ